MEPYWQLLSAQLTCLGLRPDHVEHHPSLQGLGEGDSVIIREREPRVFLGYFFAALLRGCDIWLANPDWQENRLRELSEIVGPARLLGDQTPLPASPAPAVHPLRALNIEPGAICIPTGGSSGRLKFAVHTWDSLAASANGFLHHFGQTGHRALCVLPPFHVGGLMQAVRVLLSRGELIVGDGHDPRSGLPRDFTADRCFLSLVPTQLRRLLDAGAADWLRGFKAIILGGAAVDRQLQDEARALRLPVCLSYGMTETAAIISALDPLDFINGATGVGRALPHAAIVVEPESGGVVSAGAPGRIRVRARSLARALIPGAAIDGLSGLLTNDLGYFGEGGSLHIVGRADRVIVSGGEKLDPGEIEDALRQSGLVRDVAVLGRDDPQWGQAAVAYYEANEDADEDRLRMAVRQALSPIHVPKHWVRLPTLPRNAMGKLDAAALRAIEPE